jgi:hypothetical protein
MSDNYYNPFQTSELFLPKVFQDDIKALIARKDSEAGVERTPLRKVVDFWFLSACLAIHNGEAQEVGGAAAKGWKFGAGTVLLENRGRIDMMQLAAIGVTGDLEIVKTPSRVSSLFNDCAAIGAEGLLEMASDGEEKPLQALLDGFKGML